MFIIGCVSTWLTIHWDQSLVLRSSPACLGPDMRPFSWGLGFVSNILTHDWSISEIIKLLFTWLQKTPLMASPLLSQIRPLRVIASLDEDQIGGLLWTLRFRPGNTASDSSSREICLGARLVSWTQVPPLIDFFFSMSPPVRCQKPSTSYAGLYRLIRTSLSAR